MEEDSKTNREEEKKRRKGEAQLKQDKKLGQLTNNKKDKENKRCH